MKKILVPVDFSACSANALQYALHFAARSGAGIHVLHVIFPNDGINNNMYDAFWIDDYIEQRKKDLTGWTAQICKESGLETVKTEATCEVGFPVRTIAMTANAVQAELIIMGTTGATGLKGILLGSTAGGVIGNSNIPIITVPPETVFSTVKSVVFATDFKSKLGHKAVHSLTRALHVFESQLDILHVLPPNATAKKEEEQILSSRLGNLKHVFHYIHDTDVTNAIDNFVESTQAGVLAGVAHRHSVLHELFFRSVSRALAGRTQVPFLVLHDE